MEDPPKDPELNYDPPVQVSGIEPQQPDIAESQDAPTGLDAHEPGQVSQEFNQEAPQTEPHHSKEQIDAWGKDQRDQLNQRYKDERTEMQSQHDIAVADTFDELAVKQENDREEIITALQATHEQELADFDGEYREEFSSLDDRILNAHENKRVPGLDENEQTKEQGNDDHEL